MYEKNSTPTKRKSQSKSKVTVGTSETLGTNFLRTMKLSKFVTLESGSRPKGGVGGILDGVPSLGGEHLNADGGFIFEKIKYIPEDFFEMLNKGHIYPNDIIVVKDGATTGKTSFVGNDFPHKRAVVNEHLFIVRVDPKVAFPKYVFYCLFSNEGQKQILSDFRGATIGGISRNFPQKVNVPIPSMPEQAQIANFLDQKTEQIDELIRIKERRIELLQEQRTALINQAVTKGLDRNVEMKPSGVEWIGEIPVHWNLSMLKYAARLVYGDTLISENREEGVVPVYGSNGIIDTHSSANTLSPAIIVGRKGSLGKVQYSDVPCFVIDTAYYIDRRTSNLNLRWLYYILQSLKLERFRNSVLPGLNRESAESQYIPLITEEEQAQIANFLDRKTEQIDELIAAEQRKIELLKEYRQSLISEAVTGKIDVRNEV